MISGRQPRFAIMGRACRGGSPATSLLFAYLAISVHERPDCFMLSGPNGPVANFSLSEVAELQCQYILPRTEAEPAGCGSTKAASKGYRAGPVAEADERSEDSGRQVDWTDSEAPSRRRAPSNSIDPADPGRSKQQGDEP